MKKHFLILALTPVILVACNSEPIGFVESPNLTESSIQSGSTTVPTSYEIDEVMAAFEMKARPDTLMSTIEAHTFDFNEDGQMEYIIYYKTAYPGPNLEDEADYYDTEKYWNGNFAIYQKKDNAWTNVYSDSGTMGKTGHGVNSIMSPSFLSFVNLDMDDSTELKISTTQDGSGRYVDSYILKWDGEKIAKANIVETKTKSELTSEFLAADEELGISGIGLVTICPTTIGSDCTYKHSSTDAVGKIVSDFIYQEGAFIATNYRREDF